VLSAFLNWLVIGAIKSYTSQLIILPKCVSDTIDEYQNEQDIYTKFVNENLEVSSDLNSGWMIPAKELYNVFKEWIQQEGLKYITNREFGENIKQILQCDRKTSGIKYLNYKFKQIESNNTSLYPINLTELIKH
jgi:putative DNA primase/helicase